MKFGCCVRLRTAGVIIGYVGVVSSLLAVVMLGISMQSEVNYETYYKLEKNDLIGLPRRNCVFESTIFCFQMSQVLQLGMFFMILSVLDYALVIVGCAAKNHWYLLPFLLSKGFYLFCSFLHTIIYVFSLNERTIENWVFELVHFFACLFMLFIWLLILALNRRYRRQRISRKVNNSLTSQATMHYELGTA